jgi:carbon storage regulator
MAVKGASCGGKTSSERGKRASRLADCNAANCHSRPNRFFSGLVELCRNQLLQIDLKLVAIRWGKSWNTNCRSYNVGIHHSVREQESLEPRKEPAMLVLTRKPNEQLLIGDRRITVTVLEIRGGRVRLGIEAPDDVSIRRREIEVDWHAEVDVDSEELVGANG